MHKRERRKSRIGFALSALIGACVAYTPRASAIIINGTPAQAATNASTWDGVGTITQGFSPGTGALLDSTHVITAAHVVFDVAHNQAFAASAVQFHLNGNNFQASQIFIPAGYTDAGTQFDIAVIKLATPVTGAATWSYNTGSFTELSKNTTIVGYGLGGTGTGGADSTNFPFGTKRAADNVIDVATSGTGTATSTDGTPSHNSYSVPANMIAYDFDQTGNGNGPLGGASLGVTEGTIADGDSGAPMFQFDSASGKFVITGIAVDSSDATDRFGEVGWGTRVSSYTSFLAASIPEPTSVAMLGVAGFPLLVRRRAKR